MAKGLDPNKVRQAVHDLILPGANKLASDGLRQMKQMCPVDTGRLQATGRSEVFDRGDEIRIRWTFGGGGIDYALYQEVGTSDQPAQPYVRPVVLPLNDMSKLAAKLRQGRGGAARGFGE